MKLTTEDKVEQFLGEALIMDADLVVLVEDAEDEAFWQMLLKSYLPDKKTFFPYWESNGKDGLLNSFGPKVSDKLIVCVDADNETIINSKHSKSLSPRIPFIFHTHTHSRENHFIYPINLTTECREITRKEHDFVSDFAEISRSIHPWLMLWLFCREESQRWLEDEIHDLPQKIAWSVLEKIVTKTFSDARQTNSTLANWRDRFLGTVTAEVRGNVETVYQIFEANGYNYLNTEIATFSEDCPIPIEESLFFIQGHIAFDAIMKPYFHNVVSFLSLEQVQSEESQDRQNHWQKTAVTNYNDRLSISYRTCLIPPHSCHYLEKIKLDIGGDFQKNA